MLQREDKLKKNQKSTKKLTLMKLKPITKMPHHPIKMKEAQEDNLLQLQPIKEKAPERESNLLERRATREPQV